MKKQNGFSSSGMMVVALGAVVVVLGGGWIANIVKLVGIADGGINGMLIARAIGIFVAPMGGVLGFI
jgi:hypothetical protein